MAIAKNKVDKTNTIVEKTVNTGFDFESTVLTHLKGETPAELASEIKESALSAYESYIPAQKGLSVQLRRNIKEAEKALILARVNNAKDITDSNDYISKVRTAKANLETEKAKLKANNELVAELTAELAFLQ